MPDPAEPTTSNGTVQGPTQTGNQAVGNADAFALPPDGSPLEKPITFDETATTDVVHDYPWTLSNVEKRTDIPTIKLFEHRTTESILKRQVLFYGLGQKELMSPNGNDSLLGKGLDFLADLGGAAAKTGGLLDVYREIFPDSKTGNIYEFPYFTESYMELSGPNWLQMDEITKTLGQATDAISNLVSDAGKFIGKKNINNLAQRVSGGLNILGDIGGMAQSGQQAYLRSQYPVVGMYDRPRIFSSHNERSVTIEFPLFNTVHQDHWKKNRNLLYKLMSKFLFFKTSFITGAPPVFYRVLVPGQYFSFASCVTDYKVRNLGNTRLIEGNIIPDAFQVSITLTEMCMPSINQFQAMASGEALDYVDTKTK